MTKDNIINKGILKSAKKDGYTMHHIFTKKEVEEALIKSVGVPETLMEKRLFGILIHRLHERVPKIRILRETHIKIHKEELED